MQRTFATSALGLAAVLALAGCGASAPPKASGPTLSAAVDYPSYSSLEDLGSHSQIVVRGTFKKHLADDFERSFAEGGDPAQSGLPVSVWSFDVRQQLKGPPVGSTIRVLTFDLERVDIDGETPVTLGASVVIFLARERNGVWARTGGDQAVLDVAKDGAMHARRAASPALSQQVARMKSDDVAPLMSK